MYEYQDEKIKKQLDYDKLLQKYQVQLATVYTIPTGLFFSILSVIGLNEMFEFAGIEWPSVFLALAVFIVTYIFFNGLLNKTEIQMRYIKKYLVELELQILEDKKFETEKSKRRKKS